MLKDQPSTAADGVAMPPPSCAACVGPQSESRQVLSLQVKARLRTDAEASPQALLDTRIQVAALSSFKSHN
jgi:hypothetical protein